MRIRTRSIIVVLSRSATQVVTIGMAITLVRLLSKGQFGTYRQVMLIVTMLSGLLGLNLPASLYYFVPQLGAETRRSLLTQTLLISGVMSSVIGLLMYFGAGLIARWFGNPELEYLLRLFSLYPLSTLIMALVPAFMISIDRALRSGVYTIAHQVVRACIVLTLAWAGQSLGVILSWLMFVVILMSFIAALDMYRLSPGPLFSLDRKLFRSQLGYVLPLLAATIVGLLSREFDKLLISTFFTPEDFAVYACGAIHLPVIGILTGSVFAAVMPDFVRLWRDDKKIELLRLWNTAVRKCSLAIYPCFAFCLVCSQDIIVFVYGAGYREATWPFMIYLFELPVRVAVYGAVLRATGQTKPVVIGAIVGITTNVVVSIGLVYFARYVYGPQSTLMFLGPSIGTVVGIPVAVTYMLVQIMRSVDMPFSKIMPWKQLGLVMGNCLLAAIVVGCLPLGTVSVLVRLLLRAPIFAVVLLGTGLLTGMFDAGERKLLVGLLRSVGIGRNRSS